MYLPRRPVAAVGTAVALAIVAGPVLLWQQGTGGDGRLVKFTAVQTASRDADAPPRGVSTGDRFTMTQDLITAGRTVGTTNVNCGYLNVASAGPRTHREVKTVTVRCIGRIDLPEGRISFAGRNTFQPGTPTSSRFDLLNGTGAYRGITGELIADEDGAGRSTLWLDRFIDIDDRPDPPQAQDAR